MPHVVQSNVLQSPQYMGSQGSIHHETIQMQAQRYIQHQNAALLQHAGLMGQPLGASDEALALDTSNPFSLNSGTTQSTLSSLGDFSDASNFAHMLQEILGDGDGESKDCLWVSSCTFSQPVQGYTGLYMSMHGCV